ncbi:MAG: hypothetical protein ACLTQL_13760 [Eisenbergiella sp.]
MRKKGHKNTTACKAAFARRPSFDGAAQFGEQTMVSYIDMKKAVRT